MATKEEIMKDVDKIIDDILTPPDPRETLKKVLAQRRKPVTPEQGL